MASVEKGECSWITFSNLSTKIQVWLQYLIRSAFLIGYVFLFSSICLFELMLYVLVKSFIVVPGHFLGWTGTKQRIKHMSCSRTQHSASSEAPTRNHSISSQALYHWATISIILSFVLIFFTLINVLFAFHFCQTSFFLQSREALSSDLWHQISNNMVCATSKASDQPALMHSLISAFAYPWIFYDCSATGQTSFGVS